MASSIPGCDNCHVKESVLSRGVAGAVGAGSAGVQFTSGYILQSGSPRQMLRGYCVMAGG